jgi:L-asparaginase
MKEMKKILLLTTGGTIASRPTAEGLAPGMDGTVLTSYLAGFTANYDLTVRDILHLDSSNIQPEEWQLIAHAVYDACPDFDGIARNAGAADGEEHRQQRMNYADFHITSSFG